MPCVVIVVKPPYCGLRAGSLSLVTVMVAANATFLSLSCFIKRLICIIAHFLVDLSILNSPTTAGNSCFSERDRVVIHLRL